MENDDGGAAWINEEEMIGKGGDWHTSRAKWSLDGQHTANEMVMHMDNVRLRGESRKKDGQGIRSTHHCSGEGELVGRRRLRFRKL